MRPAPQIPATGRPAGSARSRAGGILGLPPPAVCLNSFAARAVPLHAAAIDQTVARPLSIQPMTRLMHCR